jgi:hypothetical protein
LGIHGASPAKVAVLVSKRRDGEVLDAHSPLVVVVVAVVADAEEQGVHLSESRSRFLHITIIKRFELNWLFPPHPPFRSDGKMDHESCRRDPKRNAKDRETCAAPSSKRQATCGGWYRR